MNVQILYIIIGAAGMLVFVLIYSSLSQASTGQFNNTTPVIISPKEQLLQEFEKLLSHEQRELSELAIHYGRLTPDKRNLLLQIAQKF